MKYVYSFDVIGGGRSIYRTNNKGNAKAWFKYMDSEGRNPKWLRQGHWFFEQDILERTTDRGEVFEALRCARITRKAMACIKGETQLLPTYNKWRAEHAKYLERARTYSKWDSVSPFNV